MNEIYNIYVLYYQIQDNINGYNCTHTTHQFIVLGMYLHRQTVYQNDKT